MGAFDNKVVVVTGAAGRNNMGQGIARRFAREGAKVVVSGRHAEELESLAREIDAAAKEDAAKT